MASLIQASTCHLHAFNSLYQQQVSSKVPLNALSCSSWFIKHFSSFSFLSSSLPPFTRFSSNFGNLQPGSRCLNQFNAVPSERDTNTTTATTILGSSLSAILPSLSQILPVKLSDTRIYFLLLVLRAKWVAVLLSTVFVTSSLLRKFHPTRSFPSVIYQANFSLKSRLLTQLFATIPYSRNGPPLHVNLFTETCPVFRFPEAAEYLEIQGGSRSLQKSVRQLRAPRSLVFASTTIAASAGQVEEAQEISKVTEESAPEFAEWLSGVKADAIKRGVSERVLESALKDAKVSKAALRKSRNTPEVKLTLDAYLKRMVDKIRITRGAKHLQDNATLLAEISKQYGVPSNILVSIWGIETSYGAFMGEWDVIQALVTTGFKEELVNRRTYFRGELIEAMVMLERGIGPRGTERMQGSWAGAMGQCQFMPTSFCAYAVDHDGDGRRDIWESRPDILASIANFIKEHGWKEGGPLFQKVKLAKKVDNLVMGVRGALKTVADWEREHGVCLDPGSGTPLSSNEMTNLVMPDGPKGEAYLVCHNFRVILHYNANTLYGFAVCELASRIQEQSISLPEALQIQL